MRSIAFHVGVNPEPWVVPPFSPARVGKKLIVKAGRDQGLHAYQEAIKDELRSQNAEMLKPPYGLKFWFFHRVEQYRTQSGRTVTTNIPDVTNLQKAAEDALQGLVIDNDRHVIFTQSARAVAMEDPYFIIEVIHNIQLADMLELSPAAHLVREDFLINREKVVEGGNEWPPRA